LFRWGSMYEMRRDFKHQGRKLKLDIACDVMNVISGAERPTRIMSKANLTLPMTTACLGVILDIQMITKRGSRREKLLDANTEGIRAA